MRYLDLAVAALIGTSAVAGIVAFSPGKLDSASRSLTLESQIRDELLSVLQNVGTAWLVQTPPGVVCGYLQSISNATVTFSAIIGPMRCAFSAPPGASVATLVLQLTASQVVLEGWTNAQA
jgi:hypothetical protein